MEASSDLKKIHSDIFQRKILGPTISFTIMFFLIAALGDIALIAGTIQNGGTELIQNLTIELGVFIAFVIIIVVLSPRQKNFVVENHELIFYNFYKFYQELEELSKNNSKDAKKEIKTFSNFVKNWVWEDAPKGIHELPNSISKSLEEDIIPLIERNNKPEIENLKNYFLEFCGILIHQEPTFSELLKFKNSLEEFGIPKKAEEEAVEISEKVIAVKKPKSKGVLNLIKHPYVIGIAVWVVMFTIFYLEQHGISMSAFYSTVAAGVVAGIVKKQQKQGISLSKQD